jgi:hypothetical protein
MNNIISLEHGQENDHSLLNTAKKITPSSLDITSIGL